MALKRVAANPSNRRVMRILWTHNFNPEQPNSQVYMNTAARGLIEHGINQHSEYLGNLRSITSLLAARRRLKCMAIGYDLVHAQYESACAVATASMNGIPKVVSIRGNDWNLHSNHVDFHYFHSRLARRMTCWSLKHYDCVLTVSRRIAMEVQRYSPDSNVAIFPSPIDLTRFVPRDKTEARALLGFPDCTEKWILFSALDLNEPNKRFVLAKTAFELAKAKIRNLRLCVASDVPYEQMPLFTAACDIILCTSETEGWPNCVKEALACNVPFVSTDVSDLRDIVRQEPICRVCPADPALLADNLCEVLSYESRPDLRKRVAFMSLDSMSDRLVSIYKSLLSQTRSVGDGNHKR
jgi:glycosyltransferase involved in cell wall biosynthesis